MKKYITLLLSILITTSTFGTTYKVSAGSSIQSALDLAVNGDSVLVAAGIFNELLVIDQKSISLLGGYNIDFSNRNISQNISSLNGNSSAAVVKIVSCIGTTVDGFTIRNGQRGILIDEIAWPEVSFRIKISNNIIENNGPTSGNAEFKGGGIKILGDSIYVLNNIIRNNSAGRGAGLSTVGAWDYVVDGNLIENNIIYGDHAGGIYANGKGLFSNNIVKSNRVEHPQNYGWGGGIMIYNYGEGEIHLENNIWTDNYCPGPGAGVFVDEEGIAFLKNELIYNNISDDVRSGAEFYADESYLHNGSIVEITNSTIYGRGMLIENSTVTINNSIIWDPNSANNQDNDPTNNNFRFLQNGILNISYSSFQDPTQSGVGTITTNPLFANTTISDFHLRSKIGRWVESSSSWIIDTENSPAIDGGNPADPYNLEPLANGRVNMGCYGNTVEASKSIGANIVLLQSKIFIEGAYNSNYEMITTLDVPLTSPYIQDPRTIQNMPENIVDWILIELRETPTGETIISKSALLHKDGRIVADNGTTENIEVNAPVGEYYIIIKHRNHIAIMSNEAVPFVLSN